MTIKVLATSDQPLVIYYYGFILVGNRTGLSK